MRHNVRRKIKELREQAAADMMFSDRAGAVASGRFAALTVFLAGMSPVEAEQGLGIIPAHWPQRQGWREMIEAFRLIFELENW